MEEIAMRVVIERPIQEVFAFLSDLENDLKWRREWVEAEKSSGRGVGVGATFRLVSEFLGRRIPTVYEVIEYEPHRTAAWKTVSGPLPLAFRRSFEGFDGGTRVTMSYAAEVRGFIKLFKPLLVSSGRRQLAGDLPRLKELMEAGAL